MRHRLSVWAAALFLAAGLAAPASHAASFTDSAGRQVEVPDPVARVFPAGPPASVFLYMLAPDSLVGWTAKLSPAAREYIPQRYADLPVVGRLTGRGNTTNLESVVRMAPDVILDIGYISATYSSLADRVRDQTHIPTILMNGRLADSADAFRKVGALLGVGAHADEMAAYADQTLTDVRRRTEAIPPDKRVKVYFARGPRGLQTGVPGSINMEVMEFVAANNVVANNLGAGGLVDVSLEQVIAWQPEVIVTVDPGFYKSVWTDPLWQSVKAVRDKRVYLAPGAPFPWTDEPPSANRLIGVRWLAKVLYPKLFPEDMRAETKRFYALFYHQVPSDQQLDALLAGSTPPG